MADEDDVELAVAVEVCDDGLGRDVGGESDGGGEGSIAVAEHNSGESVGAELWVGAAAEDDVREAVVVEVGDDDGGCASGAGVEAGAGGGEGDALGVCAEGAVGDGAEGDGAGGSAGGEDESVRDAVVVEVGDEDGECALCGGEGGGGEEGDDGKRDAACSAEGRRGAGGADWEWVRHCTVAVIWVYCEGVLKPVGVPTVMVEVPLATGWKAVWL